MGATLMGNKWVARVRFKGEQVYLGRYKERGDAEDRCAEVSQEELATKKKGYRPARGVTSRDGKWVVNITVDGKRLCLGTRDTQKEGIELREAGLERKRRGEPIVEKRRKNKYPGVSWDSRTGKWNAYYTGNRKYNIGRYATEEMARDKRDEFIKEMEDGKR